MRETVFFGVLAVALAGLSDVVINEVCYKNDAFDDGTGTLTSDWVELYNAGDKAVNLEGYVLGKKKSYAACGAQICVLPNYELGPHEFFVVYFDKNLPPATTIVKMTVDGVEKDVPWIRSDAFSLGTSTIGTTLVQDDVRLFDNTKVHTRLSNYKGEEIAALIEGDGDDKTLEENTSYGSLWDGNVDDRGRQVEAGYVIFATPTPWASNATGFTMAPPKLSHAPGVYAAAPQVTVTSADARAETLYYTLDGTDPRSSSTRRTLANGAFVTVDARANATPASGAFQTNAWIRTSPPELEARVPGGDWQAPIGSVPRLPLLRVVAAYGPGYSAEAGGIYAVGGAFARRKLPIVSLTAPAEDLFSDETGLYVPGRLYREAGYGENKWGKPNANYFRDGEIRSHFELLEAGATASALSFDFGLSLADGGTRALPQKALVCALRNSEYGLRNVTCTLFPERGEQTYKRFQLRTCGKDWPGPLTGGLSTMMKDLLLHRLAAPLALDTSAGRPVVVYLNGDYWGLHNLRESDEKYYFAQLHGLDANNIDLVAHKEGPSGVAYELDLVEGDESALADYEAFLQRIDEADLSTPAGYAVATAEMDVVNYADYIIAETFFANGDWPTENCAFWRARTNETGRIDALADGRWRWKLTSLDLAGKEGDGVKGPWRNMFAELSSRKLSSRDEPGFLINKLWENADFTENFVARATKLLNTVFHPLRTESVVRDGASEIEDEIERHMRRWGRDFTAAEWKAAVETSLVDYLALRWTNSFDHLNAKFSLGGVGELVVSASAGGEVTVDGEAAPASGWTGRFFVRRPVSATARAAAGSVFVGWSDGVSDATRLVSVKKDESLALRAVFAAAADLCVVSFDANGGTGAMADFRFAYGAAQPLPESAFTRAGAVFLGWATSPTGPVLHADAADVADLAVVPGTPLTLYAMWGQATYRVAYDANGGTGAMSARVFSVGVEQALDKCAFARAGYTCAGWARTADGPVVFADGEVVRDLAAADATVTLYAVWTEIDGYEIVFDANGGTGAMANQGVRAVPPPPRLLRNLFTRTGYSFAGWSLTPGGAVAYADGASVGTPDVPAGGSMTLYAVWTPNAYRVEFDANGGRGAKAPVTASYDAAQTWAAAEFSYPGHAFLGWALSAKGPVAFPAGEPVANLTAEAGGVVMLYAVWESSLLYPREATAGIAPGAEAPWAAAAVVYDGYAYAADATVQGVLQVKIGRMNRRTQTAKVSASFVPADGSRKLSFRNGVVGPGGLVSDMVSQGVALRLSLGEKGLGGTLGRWGVDGARNLFRSRNAAEKAAAAAALERFSPGCAAAWPQTVKALSKTPGEGWSTLSAAVASGGRARVTGLLVGGVRFSAAAQLLLGETCACVPVVVATRRVSLALGAWAEHAGWAAGTSVVGPPDGAVAGAIGGGFAGVFVDDALPEGLWLGEKGYEGWKARVTAKTGVFKGSFKVYTAAEGRPKRLSAAVEGVVIDGVGYGTATIRNRAVWAVVLR